MATINGAPIQSLDATFSWGVNPASASIVCPGNVSIAVEDEVVLNLGAGTFNGIVSGVTEDRSNGLTTRISAVDRRIFLHREFVTCSFNNAETIEDDLATPGIDRKRRFWHILPTSWATQSKTYTDTPYTVAEVLGFLRAAPTLTQAWTFETHAAQTEAVLAIDANHGKPLANVLHEVSEKQGLVFTLIGERTIRWARKGDGSLPTPPASAFDRISGVALSTADTRVTVIGDRNRYQVNLTLEPDWASGYEEFWIEAAWIDFVDTHFGPYPATAAGQAELFAKAKSITLREVNNTVDPQYSDYGQWGEVSRMEIPVWIYLREIVFKAYRVRRNLFIGSSNLNSMEIAESLLIEMDYSSGGAMFRKAGGNEYPQEKALVIARGQPVDALDLRNQKVLTPAGLDAAADLWQPVGGFQVDAKNKVFFFESAIVQPGKTSGTRLFKFPNHGILPTTHPDYNLAVPNPRATLAAADVRASITFELERYSSTHGSGNRRGPHYVSGLRKDTYYDPGSGGGVFEVEYADGDTADEKATKIAAALIAQQPTFASGGYKRRGAAGTILTGAIDRVTVRINSGIGLQEEVEYTKERIPTAYVGERELDRRTRTRELFPGQEANRNEVWMLRQLAIAKRGSGSGMTRRTPWDLTQAPVGSVHSGPQWVTVTASAGPPAPPSGETILAGQPIATSKTTGNPSMNGDMLAGIAVTDANDADVRTVIATQGVVPVRVKGPVGASEPVAFKKGTNHATTDGEIPIGTCLAEYTGTGIALLPVRMGGGGGGTVAAGLHPFQVYASPYLGSGSPPANQPQRRRVVLGYVGSRAPVGIGNEFLMELGAITTIWVRVSVNNAGEVTAVTLESGTIVPEGSDTEIVAVIYHSAASATAITDEVQHIKSDLVMTRYLSSWTCAAQEYAHHLLSIS